MISTEMLQKCYAVADTSAATGFFLIGLAALSTVIYLVTAILRIEED